MDSQALHGLGWKSCFEQQISDDEQTDLIPTRVGAHLGTQVLCLAETGEFALPIQCVQVCGDLAVGDWFLFDANTGRATRCLERESLIVRKAAGEKARRQMIAANVDTLFIVSSCNHDFNASRLERYLALASESSVQPVVVLTKADLCDDPHSLRQQASKLKSGLCVETLDARDTSQMEVLSHWCGIGQTVALVGSSGVGKSTLAMALGASQIATQGIREDDSKGRHTTTTRSIHRLQAGGLLIDTPGMRELQLAECDDGVADVFGEIVSLGEQCRFRDCTHQGEPGCAVIAAINSGELEPRRLKNYFKLQSEQARNSQSLHQRRDQSRKLGQFYKSVQAEQRRRKSGGA